MSVHHDLLRERTLELVSHDSHELRNADEICRRDPDIVLAALKGCPDALQHASPDLIQDRGFALEAVRREWRSLRFLPERLQRDQGVALAAAKRSPEALRLLPEPLRSDRAFLARAETAARERACLPIYEGECLRLVGYCNKWRLTDSKLRFQKLRPSGNSDKVFRHCLTVDLQEGCLSFQVLSCTQTYAFRVFPKKPGKDGFFRLASGNPSVVAAVVGGDKDGHGHNFFVDEGAHTRVTIYVDVAEGLAGDGSATVWYERGPAPDGCQQAQVPQLSQARSRQKPKFPKDKDWSPPRRPEEKPATKPESAKHSGGPGNEALMTVEGLGDVFILPNVGNKKEYSELVLQARSLSRKTFDHRFYLRDLVGHKHLTILAADTAGTGLRFLGYCMCDGLVQNGAVWIDHLAILKEARGKGLGRQLIRWAGMWALAGGGEALRLSALPSAVPFYRALGFQTLGTTKDKDMDRMELKLENARGLLWGRP